MYKHELFKAYQNRNFCVGNSHISGKELLEFAIIKEVSPTRGRFQSTYTEKLLLHVFVLTQNGNIKMGNAARDSTAHRQLNFMRSE